MNAQVEATTGRAFLPTAFLSGIVFALGLGLSGMLDPEKVIGFLDVTGNWQPGLAFVMGSAVIIYALMAQLARRMSKPLAFANWSEVPKPGSDLSMAAKIGNILFGIGWGLSGYCPGPALVSLPMLESSTTIFFVSMSAGFLAWEFRASAGFRRE